VVVKARHAPQLGESPIGSIDKPDSGLPQFLILLNDSGSDASAASGDESNFV
jgi:hypothetical protein